MALLLISTATRGIVSAVLDAGYKLGQHITPDFTFLAFRARGFALDLATHGLVSGVFGAGFNVGFVFLIFIFSLNNCLFESCQGRNKLSTHYWDHNASFRLFYANLIKAFQRSRLSIALR